MVGKPNLQGVENTEAIPRTYHRSRLQPGSTLFNPCSPPVPFSLPPLKGGRRPKREPDLGIFSSLSPPSSRPLPRYRVPDTKMAGRFESSFLKNARACLRATRTHIHTHTHTGGEQFPLCPGKVFQRP